MSIRDYLKELDTNQLQFALQEANNILEERSNQTKVPKDIYEKFVVLLDDYCQHHGSVEPMPVEFFDTFHDLKAKARAAKLRRQAAQQEVDLLQG